MADIELIRAAAQPLRALFDDLLSTGASEDGIIAAASTVINFAEAAQGLPSVPSVLSDILSEFSRSPSADKVFRSAVYFREHIELHGENAFPAATWDRIRSWIPAFKLISPPPRSLPSASFPAGQPAGGSTGVIPPSAQQPLFTAKTSLQFSLPQYSGAHGKATEFMESLEENLTAARLPKNLWYSYLLNNLRGEAKSVLMFNRSLYAEDFDLHMAALTNEFDGMMIKGLMADYETKLRQMTNESTTTFKIRFNDMYQKLAKMGKKPSPSSADYEATVKHDFYYRLTPAYRDTIRKKIIDEKGTMENTHDPLSLVSYRELLFECHRLDLEKPTQKGTTMPNVPGHGTPGQGGRKNNSRGPRPLKCFYCGSTTHRYERKTSKSGRPYFRCPEKAAGREPCQDYKDYFLTKKEYAWQPRQSRTPGAAPSSCPMTGRGGAANDTAAGGPPTATVLSDGTVLDQEVAITLDLRFQTAKGTFTTNQAHESLVDTAGCENLLIEQWAKNVLRLPIKHDHSPRANVPTMGLSASTAYFRQYMEVPVIFANTTTSRLRFYLTAGLSRPVLLGLPWLKEHQALVNLDLGRVTLHGLPGPAGGPTVLHLLWFGHSPTSCVNTLCATIVLTSSALAPTQLLRSMPPVCAIPSYNVPRVPPILREPILDNSTILPHDISFVAPPDETYFSMDLPTGVVVGDVDGQDPDFGAYVFTVLPDGTLQHCDKDNELALHMATPASVDQDSAATDGGGDVSDISVSSFNTSLQTLLAEYDDVFDMTAPNISNFPPVHLGLKPEYKGRVFRRPQRRLPPLVQKSCDLDGQKILDAGYGFINNRTPHNINRVCVQRKDKDGNYLGVERDRWCIDLSWVNHCLEDFDYPIPNLQDVLEGMTASTYFSELDVKEAFNSVRVSKELSDILSFTTSQGKISYSVMPFGVKWGSSIYQWNMEEGFKDFLNTILFLYIDNLIVHTDTLRAHLDGLRQILQGCRELNLKLRKDKCDFAKTTIRTMGFVVQRGSLQPDPSKIAMVKSAPIPTNASAVRRFLGLLQFYRSTMAQLSTVAQPLYRLTSDNVPFVWTPKHQRAFEVLKNLISEDTLRRSLEGGEDIVVYTDASKFAICIVITQRNHLIHAASKVLKSNEKNWHIIEKEALTISWGLQKLDYYLIGRSFTLYTDHKPLLSIFDYPSNISNQKLLQCVLSVSEFTFCMKYLEGKRNVIADFGSRDLDPALYHDDNDDACNIKNLHGVPPETLGYSSSAVE
jgi:hypothetical protein